MNVVAKPIEMIAWFDKSGKPSPLRFKIQNEDESSSVIKVDKVITKEVSKLAGNLQYIFNCQSNIEGIEQRYELRYEMGTCKWILFKI